ncbi:hypothetical protein DRN72_03375 [Methanosarcinales archaeon]|nr:MAG: hypothetical protein DRN72_03375 [Methanosarcinales archaeon]
MSTYLFVSEIMKLCRWYKKTRAYVDLLSTLSLSLFIFWICVHFGLTSILHSYDRGYVEIGGVILWHSIIYTFSISIVMAEILKLSSKYRPKNTLKEIIKNIERNHSFLREKLSCAWDNREKEGFLVRKLSEEVALGLRNVRYSEFVSIRKLCVSVFIIVSISIISITPVENVSQPILADLTGAVGGSGSMEELNPEKYTTLKTKVAGSSLEGSEDVLFGEASIGTIEEGSIQLVIYSGAGSEVLVRDVNATEQREFTTSPSYPVVAEGYESYSEELPPAHRDLIKSYFEKLSEGSK